MSPPSGGRPRLYPLPSAEGRLPVSVNATGRRGSPATPRGKMVQPGGRAPSAPWRRGSGRGPGGPALPHPRPFPAGPQGRRRGGGCPPVATGPLPLLGASASAGLERMRRLRGAVTSRVRPTPGRRAARPPCLCAERGSGGCHLLPPGKASLSISLALQAGKACLTVWLLFQLVLGVKHF